MNGIWGICAILEAEIHHIIFLTLMKKFLFLLFLFIAGWGTANAQIPDGSIAPDFTATDINGNSYHLYDLLDAGKAVFLDISATWCGPCWNYHNTHAFRNLWETYGPDGTDEAFCFLIEGDAATNTACLYGPAGCVGGTQGDWVTGTPYPIVDDAGIANSYQITYFPTIYFICPIDKKVYEAGQLSMAALWAFRNSHCAPPPISLAVNATQNVRCYNTSTGAISITASGGDGTFTYHWSNGATSRNLSNLPAGSYTVSVTSGGQTFVSDPIDILQPGEPLSAEVVSISPMGCNGVLGSITVTGTGGWDGYYAYHWSNNQNTETASGLSPGTYKATITDEEGCTTTITQALGPAVYPVSSVAPPPMITCSQQNVQLNGSNSSSGDEYSYQWFASSGGHIVSGATGLTPLVDAAGNYTLQVTNVNTTCAAYTSVSVNSDLSQPAADAGPNGVVSCPVPLDTLSGTGSSGAGYAYGWAGNNVVSGGNTLNPVIGAPGVYTLTVTNMGNGCTQTSTTTVTGFNTPPGITTNGGALTCSANSIVLNTSTNTNHPTFNWTGPNGFASTVQSPNVDTVGIYQVTVNDTITGCSNTATATVIYNTQAPVVSTSAGSFTCVLDSATVIGMTPDTNATYAWTGPNGFASTMPSFVTHASGAYSLVITDPDNGCTASSTATVIANTLPPVASAVAPGNLNCSVSQLQLNGTGSEQGNNISYAWQTGDGHIISGEMTQTPLVDATGTYVLTVSNANNGCTNTAAAVVMQSAPVSSSVSNVQDVACFGGASGTATIAGSGGNGNYSYQWSNGQNTATSTGLSAGAYGYTVTDGENCSHSGSVNITQPATIVPNAVATAQSMNGVNDGTAAANPVGGTGPYTFLWSNGATTQSIDQLEPGNYTVSITDSHNCTAFQTVTVNTFNCTVAVNVTGIDVHCFGGNDGTASIEHTGGTDPFTFAWSNGANTQSVSGLAAGTYTVLVMDANNCPVSLSVSINEPQQLHANATATNETSNGASDGTATAAPTGGSGNYTYLWSNGETTPEITGLAPGTYTVQVNDGAGCTTEQLVVVNPYSCTLATSSVVVAVSCPGANNGAITVATLNGEAPFTYSWSNGANSASINNLAGGVYSVSIIDANSCQFLQSFQVEEPASLVATETMLLNPVCPNDPSGAADISVSGGTGPYSVSWNNGQSGTSLVNVVSGIYTAQITDARGCSTQKMVTVFATDNEAPQISTQSATLSLDHSGSVAVTLADLQAVMNDNCGIQSYQISPAVLDCQNLGDNIVTLTVTDLSGNSSSTTAKVSVLDTEAPVVTCPADIVVCSYDNFVSYQPAIAEDNCLVLNGSWHQTSGLHSPSEFPTGTTVQTFNFSDASGNIGTCSFSVTVLPPFQFDQVSVSNAHNGLSNGSVHLEVSGGTAPYSFSWTLNGQVVGDTKDLESLGAGSYMVEVTDANGCVYTHGPVVIGNSVSTHEPSWLTGVSMQPNPTSDQTRVIFSQSVAGELEISIYDATGRFMGAQIQHNVKAATIDCSELPSGIYTVQFRTNHEFGARKLSVIK